MTKPLNKVGAAVLVLTLGTGLTACTSVTAPDQVGLYYLEGSSDGYTFDHCTIPSKTDEFEWNNSIIYLPTGRQSWLIDDTDSADDKNLIVVSAAPQEGQPSGIQVKVSSQTGFVLNTFCGKDNDGGVVKSFWETIGRSNQADTPDGWRRMLGKTLIPSLQTMIRDVIRGYSADALVANRDGIQAKASEEIAARLAVEVNRMAGGQFFCGPTDDRGNADCSPIEFRVVQVEYLDKGIQDARNNKQVATEQAAADLAKAQGAAAALVAEAKGKADAARELAKLYATPGWVDLQKQIIQATALIDACKAARECVLVAGSNGNVWVGH